MNNEYIIINKTVIEKRIKELKSKRESDECSDPRDYSYLCGKIHELRQVLQLSTPLIPEIEKAFDKGGKESENSYFDSKGYKIVKQDYISNLKLDI